MDAKIIGAKIASARKEMNFSQAGLAQLLFISPQAVGKWERGESVPDILTFNRLAEVLGVDLNYFSGNLAAKGSDVPVNATREDRDKEMSAKLSGSNAPVEPTRPLLTNFNGSNLSETDLSGVSARNSKFYGSALQAADFSGADLTGSTFTGSDARGANFDGADLTDCVFSASNLSGARFCGTILRRSEFSASGLEEARFTGSELIEVKLLKTDLRKTMFENCTFRGVDFKYSDLRGMDLGNQSFTDVKFDSAALNEAVFKGATLTNVSFRPGLALTNKFYKAIKTINFTGATMDKLTYATLKGMGAELSNVDVV